MTSGARAEIVVDLAAIRHNVRRLREIAADSLDPGVEPPKMMTVVKADGYGHGVTEVSRAAREGGADWLGAATLEEALAVRDGGDTGPLLCWLTVPGDHWGAAIERDIDVTAYSLVELAEIEAAAERLSVAARVQLKVDTGLTRGGCPAELWPALVAECRAAELRGTLRITGIWSHLACADEPDHPANDSQEKVFLEALDVARQAGLRPEVRHLANSAATVLRPSVRFDMVRCGIATYGLDPAPGVTRDLGLVPAMTVRAPLAMVKSAPAGTSVSYGHTWTADVDTRLGLVPVGYAEGLPRVAANKVEVWLNGKRRPERGIICMDQFMIDLGDDEAHEGDLVEIFGTGHDGAPTALDWARAAGTINYEVVTRIGGRLHRVHVDSERGRG
ncbi:alanine racemase [Nocardioides sp. JQ2195]|uniref:alanine racemase n=1 Tax=Nocardioides sp. JQ2195 TaxID=2592334 RepID=UPI00143ED28D|nr:alanine racemase [Nocardioides sp. JQ2195]QIX25800.1 alanine racemase [Nocardioides sp. JQ2195]